MNTKINVSGMTCMHCVGAVSKSLEEVPGVETVEVSLETGLALVTGTADVSTMLSAIEEAGYNAEVE